MHVSKIKKIIFTTALFVIAHSAFAEPLSVIVEPVVSYNRETFEYSIYEFGDRLNSRLEWYEDYLFKTGVGITLQKNKMSFPTMLCFNLPFQCGTMYDSDWYVQDLKTNRSKGDLHSRLGFDFSTGFEYTIELAKNFSVIPMISIGNSYKKLIVKNNIGLCGDRGHTKLDYAVSWDDPQAKRVRKYGIDLFYNATNIYLGAGLQKQLGPVILQGRAEVSPFTYLICVDHHLGKEGGSYCQLIQTVDFYRFGLNAEYKLNDTSSFALYTSYSFSPTRQGDYYFGYFKIENIKADEKVTMSSTNLSIKLLYRILF